MTKDEEEGGKESPPISNSSPSYMRSMSSHDRPSNINRRSSSSPPSSRLIVYPSCSDLYENYRSFFSLVSSVRFCEMQCDSLGRGGGIRIGMGGGKFRGSYDLTVESYHPRFGSGSGLGSLGKYDDDLLADPPNFPPPIRIPPPLSRESHCPSQNRTECTREKKDR